jgi:hypothetical protein
MNLDKTLDHLFERPVLGLPMRMIFMCYWHRIHAALIFLGIVLLILSRFFHVPILKTIGFLVGGPSMLCMALLPILAITFLAISKLGTRSQYNSEQGGGEERR